MNKLHVIALTVFSIAVIVYASVRFNTPVIEVTAVKNAEQLPDFIAEQLTSDIYNKDGQLSHIIHADRMLHYSKQGITEFDNPIYTIYPENKQTTWQVTAKSGTLNHNNKITLKNRVKLVSDDKNSLIQEIHCKNLEIDLNTNIVSSDQTIMIQGKDFTMYGSGLIVDLNATQMTLTEHVQTIYQKNPS